MSILSEEQKKKMYKEMKDVLKEEKFRQTDSFAQERQKRMMVSCPKCKSTQISTNKKGFSTKKAIIGGVLAGLAGSNKVIITCLNCGHKWKPGEYRK